MNRLSRSTIVARPDGAGHQRHADEVVLDEIPWGRPDVLFTPAFWADQLRRHPQLLLPKIHRLGSSLLEETAACVLGGHGIRGEVGIAALRQAGLIDSRSSEVAIQRVLVSPLEISGKRVHFRFPNQKARFLHSAIRHFSTTLPPTDELDLRAWLTRIQGIGMKTASWIVRNWLDSDRVAILDVHLHRAGLLTGFFSPDLRLARDYHMMEQRFLTFCERIHASPRAMDALIWMKMRRLSRLASRILRC